ncbi:hypothetical protein SAMN05421811_106459 [Nonomuraea wenchangensis]|uniref:Uncharacterized protein n=1 Tax=Nonomuraea wenchangensis TaxID=568860 RepID=A0A1I0JZA9_9ACTN|nr:hypothetical protein SAMN05421811_106459 [Nonomuraea wenchangensis]
MVPPPTDPTTSTPSSRQPSQPAPKPPSLAVAPSDDRARPKVTSPPPAPVPPAPSPAPAPVTRAPVAPPPPPAAVTPAPVALPPPSAQTTPVPPPPSRTGHPPPLPGHGHQPSWTNHTRPPPTRTARRPLPRPSSVTLQATIPAKPQAPTPSSSTHPQHLPPALPMESLRSLAGLLSMPWRPTRALRGEMPPRVVAILLGVRLRPAASCPCPPTTCARFRRRAQPARLSVSLARYRPAVPLRGCWTARPAWR